MLDYIKKIKNFLPSLVWMLIIFLFSSRPNFTTGNFDLLDFFIKKTAHLTEYSILYLLIIYGFIKNKIKINEKIGFYILLFCTIYAISDEFHQSFVYGRTSSIRDVWIDFTGAFSTMLVLFNFFDFNLKFYNQKS